MSTKTALLNPDPSAGAKPSTEVFEQLCAIFADQFELEGECMTLQARLVADLDLDSLDFVALATEIEYAMGVVLEESDFRDCETLGDLVDRVTSRATGLDG